MRRAAISTGVRVAAKLALVSLLLATGLAAGLTAAATAAEPVRAATPIKLSAAPYLSSAPFFIALDLGLFAAEGLSVELVDLVGGPTASLPALAQGQVDVVGGMLAPGFFNLAHRGAPIRIVAGRAYESREGCTANAAVVRKGLIAEGRLGNRAALRGLRLSTDRTGAGFFYTDSLLQSAGLSIKDVVLSDIAIPARGEALARNLIDVTMAFEPGLTQILDSGGAEIWIPAREIVPDFQYSFLLFGSRLLVEDRDAGRRFLRAYLAGVARYLDEGKSPRLVEILARHTHLDAGLLQRACWPATARDGAIDAASLERYQAWAVPEGLIDARVDLSRLVDGAPLEGVATEAGASP